MAGEEEAARTGRNGNRFMAMAVALAGLLAVGWIDWVTSDELRVFPLYFLPLTWVSLRLGRGPALALATLCAVSWFVSDHLAHPGTTSLSVALLNATIMLLAFGFIAALTVSQRRSLEIERVLGRTDSLTGLPNGRGFFEAAAVELVRSRRYQRPVTLAYLDVDDFKSVNDRFGHARGDALLVAVAQALRRTSRASDVLGRLGGDEFAILYSETGRVAADAALRNLQAHLRDSLRDGGWPPLTLSIGAVTSTLPPPTADTLVRRADALMYEVKMSGKNDVRTAEGLAEAS